MARLNTQTFIQKANIIHNEVYDYSKVVYKSYHVDVTITCAIHGDFTQKPVNHLYHKTGCPACNKRHTRFEQFIQKARAKHNDTYDYSKVTYNNAFEEVIIVCPSCGPFTQTPRNHLLANHPCNSCARCNTQGEFESMSIQIHGDRYDYSSSTYINAKTPVKIICRDHGEFTQTPDSHIYHKHGCPACGDLIRSDVLANIGNVSKGESELFDFISTIAEDTIIQNDRTILKPKELDIVIPAHNLAIEFCGVYWHSEQLGKDRNYHKNKMDECDAAGYQLLTIFEDEWSLNKVQVKAKLSHILGSSTLPKVSARRCNIKRASLMEAKTFLNNNHIQGYAKSTVRLGLYMEEELVACVLFCKRSQHTYELCRYATSAVVRGGFSKLVKHFITHYHPQSIISFADLRWSSGDLYTKTGWKVVKKIPPDYSYVRPGRLKREHKFGFRHKHLQQKLNKYDPTTTERVNCDNNGLLRVWDCGKIKYELNFE